MNSFLFPKLMFSAQFVRRLRAALGASLMGWGMSANIAAANENAFEIFSAGSLREAMSALEAAYRSELTRDHVNFAPTYLFGPSGRLRERIENGATPALFASAAPSHTERLLASGQLRSSNEFAGNALCVMARPGFALNQRDIANVLLADDVVVGTSTPGADPSGDYTWEMFKRIDAAVPGAFAKLDAKAKKLTGADVNASETQSPYVTLLREKKADVSVSYCTNAKSAQKIEPAITYVELPAQFNVISNYSIGIAPNAPTAARDFLRFILSERSKPALASLGFSAPNAQCENVPAVVSSAHDARRKAPERVLSHTDLKRAISINLSTRYQLQLLPSNTVALARVAKASEIAKKQNAGVVQVVSSTKTHLELFADRRAWIDVVRVRDGRVLDSIRSERWLGCAGVGKNLGFQIDANETYRIEVSEVDGDTIDLLAMPLTLSAGVR